MPHSLTERQKECLEYIREYIAENESSPRLDEIASHFDITSPSAHNHLRALRDKGFLYFGRTRTSGFFIRLIERAGSAEMVAEINLAGKINRYGEVYEFPEELGHLPSILIGSKPDELFALVVMEDIPQASMRASDFIIFDVGKKPQPGDICIAPIGERLFLLRIDAKTFDKDTPSILMAQEYPIPEKWTNPELEQEFFWTPLAYDEDNRDYFIGVTEEQHWPIIPLQKEFILATALRLIRALAF